mmetsp:Transcript_120040/g.334022  ORF Transcript_120040/g.334022 Transcript_120040/m.334022 type:complete len:240 (-) Transcript_120040:206-925(-)
MKSSTSSRACARARGSRRPPADLGLRPSQPRVPALQDLGLQAPQERLGLGRKLRVARRLSEAVGDLRRDPRVHVLRVQHDAVQRHGGPPLPHLVPAARHLRGEAPQGQGRPQAAHGDRLREPLVEAPVDKRGLQLVQGEEHQRRPPPHADEVLDLAARPPRGPHKGRLAPAVEEPDQRPKHLLPLLAGSTDNELGQGLHPFCLASKYAQEGDALRVVMGGAIQAVRGFAVDARVEAGVS